MAGVREIPGLVRQCGKTYIVEEFAKEHFESYVYVNFESSENLSAIFDYDFDVNRIIKEIEIHYKTRIIPVEVKSADNTQAKSYRQFCKKIMPPKGVKLSEKNIAVNLCEKTTTYSIPLYLGWNIDHYI